MKLFVRFTNRGQSLVETIVAVGIVTLVLVAMISAITFSLANAQFAKNKTLASKYGQEAIEWLRNQRQTFAWNIFYGPTSTTALTFCLNTFPVNITSLYTTPGVCGAGTVINGTIFTRQAVFLGNPTADRVQVNMLMTWPQGSRTSQVVLDTYLTKWQ